MLDWHHNSDRAIVHIIIMVMVTNVGVANSTVVVSVAHAFSHKLVILRFCLDAKVGF